MGPPRFRNKPRFGPGWPFFPGKFIPGFFPSIHSPFLLGKAREAWFGLPFRLKLKPFVISQGGTFHFGSLKGRNGIFLPGTGSLMGFPELGEKRIPGWFLGRSLPWGWVNLWVPSFGPRYRLGP